MEYGVYFKAPFYVVVTNQWKACKVNTQYCELMFIKRNKKTERISEGYIQGGERLGSSFCLGDLSSWAPFLFHLTDKFPDIAGSPEQLELLVIPVFANVCFPPGHFLHEL